MPLKLIALLGLMVLSALASLVTASYVSLAVTCLLFVLVLKGSEGARNIMVILAVVGLASGLVAGAQSFDMMNSAFAVHREAAELAIVSAAVMFAQCLFTLWCLTRTEVKMWMFQRSMGPLSQK